MAKLKSYHFSLGQSRPGPIGYCARVIARSEKRAIEILKAALPDEVKVVDDLSDDVERVDGEGIEYIRVYLNDEAITKADIDEVNEIVDEHENHS